MGLEPCRIVTLFLVRKSTTVSMVQPLGLERIKPGRTVLFSFTPGLCINFTALLGKLLTDQTVGPFQESP